jgi:hypothetical protein
VLLVVEHAEQLNALVQRAALLRGLNWYALTTAVWSYYHLLILFTVAVVLRQSLGHLNALLTTVLDTRLVWVNPFPCFTVTVEVSMRAASAGTTGVDAHRLLSIHLVTQTHNVVTRCRL